jgi:hypothetical protein
MSPLKLLQFTCQPRVLLSRLLLRKERRKGTINKECKGYSFIPFSFEQPLNDLEGLIFKNTHCESKGIP